MTEKISNPWCRIKRIFMTKCSCHIQCARPFFSSSAYNSLNGNASLDVIINSVSLFRWNSIPQRAQKQHTSCTQKYNLLCDSCWQPVLYICRQRMRNHQNWPKSKFDILIVWGCVYFFVIGRSFANVYFHYSISKENPLMDFVVRKFNAIKFFDSSHASHGSAHAHEHEQQIHISGISVKMM